MLAMDEASNDNVQLHAQNPQSQDSLASQLEHLAIQDHAESHEQAQAPAEAQELAPRPYIVYTRSQILHLSQSPLVKLPDGMPSFKSWFGFVFRCSLSSLNLMSNLIATANLAKLLSLPTRKKQNQSRPTG